MSAHVVDKTHLVEEARKSFCPPSMLDASGNINQQYFEIPGSSGWNDVDKILLKKGIRKHGAHDLECWMKIKNEFLHSKPCSDIKMHISMILGRADLRIYEGWMKGFSDSVIEEEYNKHKRMGEINGCWRKGMYYEKNLVPNEHRWMICGGQKVVKWCPARRAHPAGGVE